MRIFSCQGFKKIFESFDVNLTKPKVYFISYPHKYHIQFKRDQAV